MATPHSKPAPGLLTRGSRPTALIDWVIASQASPHTRRGYARAIDCLYVFADGRPVTPALLQEWRTAMAGTLSAATINLRLNAVRSLVRHAHTHGAITAQEAWELLQIGGVPARGARVGHWLTAAQTRQILSVPSRKNLRGLRNYCILAILTGCALRVGELAALEVDRIQQRDERWVIINLVGKGGRVRTVAIPTWVKQAIDAWLKAARITEGRVIRQLTLKPEGLSTQAIWRIVAKAGEKIGMVNFGPHDLRRTCARLCREQGGAIEQIQEMLGHESINTTQRYLGTVQNLRNACNDNLGL